MPIRKTIQLSKLNLNQENPRFNPVESQEQALRRIVDSRNEDALWNLAKDIVEHGLNPSEMPIVYMDDEGNLTVKDGNRRVAALLAITKPTRIPTSSKAYIKRFKNLKAKADVTALRKVPCVIFDDEDEADYWVYLKHTGENNGVGTVSWNGLMTERFKGQRRRASYQLQALNFVERHADEPLKQNLGDFPITTLERLLGNPRFRDSLGLMLEDGILKYTIPKEEALRNLTKVVDDLASKRIKVSDVFTTDQMDVYAGSLRGAGYLKSVPRLERPEPVEEEREEQEKPEKGEDKRKKEKPQTIKRSKLIPEGFSLAINDPRINNIYQELKILNVDRLPNATAVLFRVFLELSINRCIEEKEVANTNVESELINKIKRVHDHFEANGILTKEEMQGVMMLCNAAGTQSIPLTKQFNGYVHNPNFHPAPGDLKTCWDNTQKFITKLWD